jgi:hypothetical protein
MKSIVFLWSEISYSYTDVLGEVGTMVDAKQLIQSGGYIALHGERAEAVHRDRAMRYSMQKHRRARWALRLLSAVPFVRAIFITNTVASEAAHATSDVDILLIAMPGRLWIVRLFSLFILDLLRLRPRPGRKAHAICPCFMVSEQSLDFSTLVLQKPDIYLIYWICQAIPVYDSGGLHKKFVQQNVWVTKFVANGLHETTVIPDMSVQPPRLLRWLKRFFEIAWRGTYGSLVNTQAKGVQMPRLERIYGAAAKEPGTRVIVSDDMVKLHLNDRRNFYQEAWQKRCEEFFHLTF